MHMEVWINTIMSQFKINSITDRSGYCHNPVISGVSTNNSTGCMIIPAVPHHIVVEEEDIFWLIMM